jgi:hypothetical protein
MVPISGDRSPADKRPHNTPGSSQVVLAGSQGSAFIGEQAGGRGLELVLLAGGQLLHGPAVAVRIAEEDERVPVELLDVADLDATLTEFGACDLYI